MTSPLNRSAQAGMGSGVEGRGKQGASFGPDHSASPSPSVSARSGECSSRGPAEDDLGRHERGAIVWHSTDEDGGPDVGMTFGLGGKRFLWLGEISDQQHAECGDEAATVGTAGGRWLVLYDESKPRGAQSQLLGKLTGHGAAETLCDAFTRFARDAEAEALETEARRAKTRRGFVADEGSAPSGATPSQSPDPLSQTVAPSTEEKE